MEEEWHGESHILEAEVGREEVPLGTLGVSSSEDFIRAPAATRGLFKADPAATRGLFQAAP